MCYIDAYMYPFGGCGGWSGENYLAGDAADGYAKFALNTVSGKGFASSTYIES